MWAELESTLREQIAAFERQRLADEREARSRDATDSGAGASPDDDWLRREAGEPFPAGQSVEVASLRADVERLTAALEAKESALVTLKASFAEASFAAETVPATLPVSRLAVDPDVAEEMEKARAEASALRDALERKDEQLRSASAREATLAAARDALQSRVSDLAVELESASNGYDAEIARVSAELASLQTMLAQREEVFEEMQGRLNREVEEESDARNREISDARAEMCQMPTLWEQRAADVAAAASRGGTLRRSKTRRGRRTRRRRQRRGGGGGGVASRDTRREGTGVRRRARGD